MKNGVFSTNNYLVLLRQEAQLSQRHRAMPSVIEYFAKSFNTTQDHLSSACALFSIPL